MKTVAFGNNRFNLREDVNSSAWVDVPVACFANSGVVRITLGEIIKSGDSMEIASVVRFNMTMQTAAELSSLLAEIVGKQQVRHEAHN